MIEKSEAKIREDERKKILEEVKAVYEMGTIIKNCTPEERKIFDCLRKKKGVEE